MKTLKVAIITRRRPPPSSSRRCEVARRARYLSFRSSMIILPASPISTFPPIVSATDLYLFFTIDSSRFATIHHALTTSFVLSPASPLTIQHPLYRPERFHWRTTLFFSPDRLAVEPLRALRSRTDEQLRYLLSSPSLCPFSTFQGMSRLSSATLPIPLYLSPTLSLVGRARSLAISLRHPCVTLRRQTRLYSDDDGRGRTKDEITSGPITHAAGVYL